jgi:hypothetical protein
VESNSGEPSKICDEGDVKSTLEKIVGDTGIVALEFGGFLITILDHSRFPWYESLNILAGDCFDVWVDRKNSNLHIHAKQKID